MPHCQLLVTQVTGSAITGKYCQESQTYRTNHLQAKIFISVIDQNQNGVKSRSQTSEESQKVNPTWESHNECNHQLAPSLKLVWFAVWQKMCENLRCVTDDKQINKKGGEQTILPCHSCNSNFEQIIGHKIWLIILLILTSFLYLCYMMMQLLWFVKTNWHLGWATIFLSPCSLLLKPQLIWFDKLVYNICNGE